MSKKIIVAVIVGLAVTAFLRYGLEPLGWLFYEASFALGIDSLYWGYSIFRGAGYAFSLWPYQWLTCVLVGGFTTLLLMRRT